jgi:hypothetical protein
MRTPHKLSFDPNPPQVKFDDHESSQSTFRSDDSHSTVLSNRDDLSARRPVSSLKRSKSSMARFSETKPVSEPKNGNVKLNRTVTINGSSVARMNYDATDREFLTATYISRERIDSLKQSDPIFAKRYKEFVTAKLINRAPRFSIVDHPIPATLTSSKSFLNRQKNEIIRKANDIKIEKTRMYQIEMEEAQAKVQKFLDKCIYDEFQQQQRAY